MANAKHIAVLKEGTPHWNSWRLEKQKEEPEFTPDFSGADLSGSDLGDAQLEFADFSGATLRNCSFIRASLALADFTRAALTKSVFWTADLEGATFFKTDLKESDFYRANLSNSTIVECKLNRTNLKYADLRGAFILDSDFSKSRWGHTVCGDVNLLTARNLDKAIHEAPSLVDLATIYKSKGEISETWLRGAGLPDEALEYVRSLTQRPIQYNSCFISYSSRDQALATKLNRDLNSHGIRNWLATEDLKIGDRFRARIEESIRKHDKLLIVLSEASVGSRWVESEVESAMEREGRESKTILFPVRIDEAVMATSVAWAAEIRRTRHIGDFREWPNSDSYKKAFDRLLRDLKAESK